MRLLLFRGVFVGAACMAAGGAAAQVDRPLGSAFAVTKDGHLVTNQHVIEGCPNLQVKHPASGRQFPASVRASDKRNDLAVLKVEHAFATVAELRMRTLSLGDTVMSYGFPLSGVLASDGVFSAGMVSATAGLRDDTARLQISNPIQLGNTGGPLLDDTGAVAGVVMAKLDAVKVLMLTGDIPQNINFAVKTEVVRLLLDTYGVQYAPAKSTKRLAPREVAERAKSFTVLVVCRGDARQQTAAAGAVTAQKPAVVAGATAPAVVASAAPAPAAAAADGMPAPGARWSYTYRDERLRSAARIFTVEVVRVQGSQVQERFSVEGGNISETLVDAGLMRFMERIVEGTNSVVELAPYSPALYARQVGTPAGYPNPLGMMWRIEQPKYAEESISVPAGRFSALRVHIEGKSATYGATNAVSRFTYTAWYSRELKRYIKIRHQTWNAWSVPLGDEVAQLVTYQPGK